MSKLSNKPIPFRVRVPVDENAPEDKTSVVIDPVLAAKHGDALDAQGFPTLSALEAWHRKNNPQFFEDEA